MMKQFLAVLSLSCLAIREASAFGGSSPEAVIKIENTSGEMTESAFNFEDDGQDQESGGRAIESSSTSKSANGYTIYKGNFKCPKGQRISHARECSQAIAALGYSGKISAGLYTNIPFGCILYGSAPLFNYYMNGPSPGPHGYGLKSICADTEKCAFPSCKSDGTYGPGNMYRVGDNDYYLAGNYGTFCPAGQFVETFDECKEAANAIPLAKWTLDEHGQVERDDPPVDDYMQGCYLNPVKPFFNNHVVTPGNKHAERMINICKKPVIPCWKKYNRQAHQCLPKGYAHEDKKNYQWDGKAIEDCRKECAQNSECVGIQFLWANGKGKKKTDSRCYHILQGDCPAISTWDTAWSKGKGKWGVETVGCWDANFDIL